MTTIAGRRAATAASAGARYARCLHSDDAGRCQRSTLVIEAHDGRAYDAAASAVDGHLVTVGETELVGWDDLDGPALCVQSIAQGGRGWMFLVPRERWWRLVSDLAVPELTDARLDAYMETIA